MNYKIDIEEKYAQITVLADKLNGAISPELKDKLIEAENAGQRNVVLDLSATKFCDSSGLSAILVGNRQCSNAGGTFVVSGARDMVMKLIKLSQLDKVLTLVPTAEEARDIIFMSEVENEFNNEK